VGDLRRQLGVEVEHDPRFSDAVLFAFWLGVGAYLLAWNVVLAPALLCATAVHRITGRRAPA